MGMSLTPNPLYVHSFSNSVSVHEYEEQSKALIDRHRERKRQAKSISYEARNNTHGKLETESYAQEKPLKQALRPN